MSEHYYTNTPTSEHKPLTVTGEYRGHTLTFQTDSGVFSRTEIDRGSRELLAALPDAVTGDVLDMGCGYGALGVSIGKHNPGCCLTMADINARAVDLAAINAQRNNVKAETLISDGFSALVNRRFDMIVINPPIRTGKQIIYKMFADGAQALKENGQMILVIRKQQGASSAMTELSKHFADVSSIAKKGGYWVIRCRKPVSDSGDGSV